MNPIKRHSIADLLDIMAKLRAPDGCPWDIKQTHASLLSCLIEETYEFVEAVENHDRENMQEELGDLLLQVVFHAQMAKENGAFNFEDVVHGISDKLIRRHPHVFGENKVDGADAVQKQWDELKLKEKGEKGKAQEEGGLGQIPKHLPALLKADKIQKRAAQAGFDWPDHHGTIAKIQEELQEFTTEIDAITHANPNTDRLESEYGDLLYAVVNLGRRFKLDPEKSLARTNHKFIARYETMEKLAQADGKTLKGMTLEVMDVYWEKAKAFEKK